MSDYRAVIGLEVHAQLLTRSKMFCGCASRFGAPPNSLTCPVCLGLPGALPVPNREAVSLAIRFALMVEAAIHHHSVFARKNYFYPDLPKGYQITQYERPLATGGRIRIEPEQGDVRWIGLSRAHLEEDAGRSVHEGRSGAMARTGIDFNRCGIPLLEIVSEPEIATPGEAHLFLERLRSILRTLEVCDGNMERGSLRVDANVSMHRRGEPPGTRVELKNLNSFRGVRRGLAYEIERQAALLASGGAVVQETRLWDETAGESRPLRGKEEVHDYRYFPEPDLPPLILDREWIDRERDNLLEPPHRRRDRLVVEYGLEARDAHRLTLETPLADYYEVVAQASGNPRTATGWVLNELLAVLRREGIGIEDCPLDPEVLAGLITLVGDGTISGRMAKTVFEEIYASGATAGEVIAARGLKQVTDEETIREAAERILAAHPRQVAQYREGKEALLGFFIGRTIEETGGQASPRVTRRVLVELLRRPES